MVRVLYKNMRDWTVSSYHSEALSHLVLSTKKRHPDPLLVASEQEHLGQENKRSVKTGTPPTNPGGRGMGGKGEREVTEEGNKAISCSSLRRRNGVGRQKRKRGKGR
jgi:hypothetical protein